MHAGLRIEGAHLIPCLVAGDGRLAMTDRASHALERLEAVASGPIAANAVRVDEDAAFPQSSLDALAEAGLLGLLSSPDVGGAGGSLRDAARVVERTATECGSTAMILMMHYCGTAVIEKYGPEALRKEIAGGGHLSTLAFSESGSRSHFWAPVSTATQTADGIRLDAHKSWVTSAHHATGYVWSSKPVSGEGASTIWYVPRVADGLEIVGDFDGMGLRGNDSLPVKAEGTTIPEHFRLGEDGAGFAVMMETVLPTFNVLNAAVGVGLMRGAVRNTIAAVSPRRYEYTGSALRDLPTIRAYVARMQIATDSTSALLADTIAAIEAGRADTMLRVLEAKAAAGEAAPQVLDLAMRVCGGAAFRREGGVDRYFRDGRAAGVMAPTTDVLYDFIGKALTGMELF